MWKYLVQLWHSEDLRKRIFLTLALLILYRFIAHIPVPGADPTALRNFLSGRGAGGALGVFAALTGGAIDNFSIVMLGLSPYINASIILQLCTVIFPKLEALSKEGQQGQQKINRYTRYLTFPLAFLQSYGFLLLLNSGAATVGGRLIETSFPEVLGPMVIVSAGALFLMWLGEVMTEKGVGNGISLIIFTGIVSSMPAALSSMFVAGAGKQGAFFLFTMLTLLLLVAVVLFTEAHRLIPITYANQGAGRGVQGGIPI
ncbi:MAG: preprotein translocase subunit SecY, partial [Patescibacteria group bacterium]